MKIGLDFDNTLISYDALFYKVALEKGLIPKELEPTKLGVRNYLRSISQDNNFTLLQGEVYGLRILEANPCIGMLNALKSIQKDEMKLLIVSHKTHTPYKGPSFDLHNAARGWLEKNGFFSKTGLCFNQNEVHFEPTKEMKVAKVIDLGCRYFIDDLPEILNLLPDYICRIHYSPNSKSDWHDGPIMRNWEELPLLLNQDYFG